MQKLEQTLRQEQTKIQPQSNPNTTNLDAIMESANIAMDRFNKRINREG